MRKIEGWGSPRRAPTNPRHQSLTRRGHVCRNLIAAPTDSRTNKCVKRTINEGAYALSGAREDPSEEPAPARVNSGDDLPGRGREDNGQTVSGLHGESRRIRPPAGINDDAVRVDGPPLPRSWPIKRMLAIHAPGHAAAYPQELNTSRVRLIHPDNIAPQRGRKRAPTFTHEGGIITHMQSNIAA